MTIKFAPVLTNYSQLRYPTILGFEESGQPSTTPYVDSRGYATIGAGFLVTSWASQILETSGSKRSRTCARRNSPSAATSR